MPTELNQAAYVRLMDEDIEWLLRQPRSLERDHTEQCLKWLRDHRPLDDGTYRTTNSADPAKKAREALEHDLRVIAFEPGVTMEFCKRTAKAALLRIEELEAEVKTSLTHICGNCGACWVVGSNGFRIHKTCENCIPARIDP